MIFLLKIAILEYSRSLIQLKTVIFVKGGIHFPSRFPKTDSS